LDSRAAPPGAAGSRERSRPRLPDEEKEETMVNMSVKAAAAQARAGLPVPCHGFPDEASALQAERYWWHLARLREARDRCETVVHTAALADAAGRIAAALRGAPPEAADAGTDPLAWADLCTYLTRLGCALDGGGTVSPAQWEADEPEAFDGDQDAWHDLADAATPGEFAAAWYPIQQNIRDRAASRPDGSPGLLRAFTVGAVIQAAAAIIDSPR
jgi:hypothetical protein